MLKKEGVLIPLHVGLEVAEPKEVSALVGQYLSKPIPVLGSALPYPKFPLLLVPGYSIIPLLVSLIYTFANSPCNYSFE